MAIDLRQAAFAFGYDDGTESTHTFIAAGANANFTAAPLDTNLLLRFLIQEAGGTAAPNLACQFQYRKTDVIGNQGAWTNITTTGSVARAVAVDAFINGAHCSNRLGGTGTFETSGAGCTEDGTSGGSANDVAASGKTETELGFQLRSADLVAGECVDFRLTVTGPTTTITYTVTPRANIVRAVTTPTLGALTVLYEAALALTLTLPTIASGAELYAATEVRGGTTLLGPEPIASTAELYAPTVAPGAVTLVAPTQLINSGATLYGGTVALGEVTLIGATLASGATLSAPTAEVGSVTLIGATLASGAALTAPVVPKVYVSLYEGATLRATRDLCLGASLASTTFALTTDERNAIGVWSSLRLTFLADGTQVQVTWAELETPAASTLTELAGGIVASGETLYAPALALNVTGATLASEATLTAPALIGSNEVIGATIASEATLLEPSLAGGTVTLILPTIASGETLYPPYHASLLVSLLEEETVRAWRDEHPTDTLTTFTFALTTEERNAITNWRNLRVSLVATGAQIQVTWVELETPEGLAEQAVTGATIASEAVLTAPFLNYQTLIGATIASGATLYAPSTTYAVLQVELFNGATSVTQWDVALTDDFATTEITFPTTDLAAYTDWSDFRLSLTAESAVMTVSWVQMAGPAADAVALPTVATAATLAAPTVSTVAVTLLAPTIAAATVLAAPTVSSLGAVTLVGATIAAGSVLTQPVLVVVEATLEPSAIASGEILYAPIVAPGARTLVSFATIPAPTLSAPSLTTGAVTLIGDTLASGETLTAPVVSQAAVLEPQTIASGETLTAPIVSTDVVTLEPPAMASGAALYGAALEVMPVYLTAGTVASGTTLYAPTIVSIAAVTILAPEIPSSAVIFAPDAVTRDAVLEPPTISATVLYAPVVSYPFTGTTTTSRTFIPTRETRTFIPDAEVRTWIAV